MASGAIGGAALTGVEGTTYGSPMEIVEPPGAAIRSTETSS